jgi:hypothetical protein
MKTTHRFTVDFADEKTSEQIEEETFAFKITEPDSKVSDTVKLMGAGASWR